MSARPSILPYFILAAIGSMVLPGLAAEPGVEAGELPRVAPSLPEQARDSFKIRPGFRIELAACEPEVVDPVAMAFDENSVLYVVEMRDYSERRGEQLSRIRRLEDRDGDGRFERSTIFLDGLPWATAVICWDGGVFVAASPDILYAMDTNGDGMADVREVVFTGFGEGHPRLNVQALLNSLAWGPDNRIHGATAGNGGRVRRVVDGQPQGQALNVDGADFSFDPLTMDLRTETGTAQFGLTFDEQGQKYVCANSAHLQWVPYTGRDAAVAGPFPLPPPLVNIPEDGPAAEVFRISPEEPWRVVRTRWRASGLVPGLVEGGGRSSGYFTSASGVHLAGGLVGRNDAFIGDVGSNLVHRKRIGWTENGPVARRLPDEQTSEFLASPDNWFRPVAFATGPDGGLYIADMYREFIEHPDSLPPALKQHLDLNSGNDRGRIWRVVPVGFVRRPWPKLGGLSAAELAGLEPETSWHTATARRLLWAMGDRRSPPAPPVADAMERAFRDRLAGILTAGRGGPVAPERLRLFFGLPDQPSGEPWEPSLSAQLARHALPSREAAAEFFAWAAPRLSRLAALRLAAFLEVALPDGLLEEARRCLGAAGLPEATRLVAVAAMARHHAAELPAVVRSGQQSPGVRAAALRAAPAAAGSLLEDWTLQPAELRMAALEILTSSPAAAAGLLDALEASRLTPLEIPLHLARQLRAVGPAAQQERAARLLPPPPANRQLVMEARQPALKLTGHAAPGQVLFLQGCATCHRAGSAGSAVGPDTVSFRNLGKPALLLNLLDPNREVAPRYFTTIVTLKSGGTLAGIVSGEDAATVRMVLPGGIEKVLPRGDIAKLERSNRSLMPEGLESAWTDQELADVLAFLVE